MGADLHIHTTASDGRSSPQEIVDQAIAAGLTHIAITDHDTVNGLIELYQGGDLNSKPLTVIPGIEFSTDLPQNEVHILGYHVDIFHPALVEQLAIIVDDRWKRVERTLTKLTRLGYPIEYNRVVELAGSATAVGRPHIARALVEKGYFANVTDVFHALLHKNGPAYVPHYKLDYRSVLKLITAAGGIPVLAHPGLIGDDRIVEDIIAAGIRGIEVYHPRHDSTQNRKYLDLAGTHHLLVTGGSDFHAIPSRFPGKLGIFTIPAELAVHLTAGLS